MLKSPLKSWQN